MDNKPVVQEHFFESHKIRTVIIDNEVWWCVVDLCKALGLKQSGKTIAILEDDEKGWYPLPTLGGPQKMVITSESGKNRLLFRSKKPAALRIQNWAFKIVFPAISQTGTYSVIKPVRQLETLYERYENSPVRLQGKEIRLIETDVMKDFQQYIADRGSLPEVVNNIFAILTHMTNQALFIYDHKMFKKYKLNLRKFLNVMQLSHVAIADQLTTDVLLLGMHEGWGLWINFKAAIKQKLDAFVAVIGQSIVPDEDFGRLLDGHA